MKITKKRLKQIIKEELALLEEERQLLESQAPLPFDLPGIPGSGGGVMPRLDLLAKLTCRLEGPLLEQVDELMDSDLADMAMDEVARILELNAIERLGLKILGPGKVASIIQTGFERLGCPR